MTDFLIVGGGICGLQLGAMLAADGRQVTVLEKRSRVGGRAFMWERDGFTVDNGIHLVRFGPLSATATVFRHLGKPINFVDLGKSHVAFPEGKVVDFPTSPGGFLTTRLMSLGERLKAVSLLLKVKSGSPGDLLDTSVKDWMDDLGIKGGLRKYLTLVSASMQVCPFIERSSAGEMLLNMQSVLKKKRSAMYPAEGWSYIYETLEAAIRSSGDIRTGTEVKRVLVENGRATGAELASGERVGADKVVVNLPVQQLERVIDPSRLEPGFAALCRNLKPTAGVSIDFGLSRRVSEDSGLWYLWEPMSFGLFTSNLCPRTAPAGKQLLTWFAPAELTDMQDQDRAAALAEKLESAIYRVFPGMKEAVLWKRSQALKMVDGVEVNVDQHRQKRPGYRVPGIEGLYLVGDSLKGPGAGGDVGHESVIECYAEITGKKPRTAV